MSRSNPERSVNALLPAAETCRCGVVVRPHSLAHYALLERIKSPIICKGELSDTLELLPSLWIMCHPAAEARDAVAAGELDSLSTAWAEALPPSALSEIRDAVARQITAMVELIPTLDDKKKTETMAGSPASSIGPAPSSAGAWTSLWSRLRPRR